MSIRATLPALLLGAVLAVFVCPPAIAASAQGSGQVGYATIRGGSLYVGGERSKPLPKASQPEGERPGVSIQKSAGSKQAESSGRGESGRAESRVELHLLDDSFFVLRQMSFVPGKEPVVRDLTGLWRQVEGGSILRLTNKHGLELGLNIGAGGNLYGDFFPLPGEKIPSFVLKLAPPKKQSFFLMGTLERASGRSSLTDSSSGKVFSPLSGEALAKLPEENPLFVDVEVTPRGKGLRVERVRSASSRFPQYGAATPTAQHFAGDVESAVWMLPPMTGIAAASCSFKGDGQGKGLLEVTGKGLRLTADYTITGAKVLFTITEQDERNLRAVGAEALTRMLKSVRTWAVEGGALVLTEAEGQSFVLEKAVARGRMGGGVRR